MVFIMTEYLSITEDNKLMFHEGAFEEVLKDAGVIGVDLYTAMNEVFNYLTSRGFEEKYIEREIENDDGFTEIFSVTYWVKCFDNFNDAYFEGLRLKMVCNDIIKKYGGKNVH